jgi:hypothetical protein
LQELFGEYGEIEIIKVFYFLKNKNASPNGKKEALYAFVCFKNPEDASKAKAKLHKT